MIDSDNTVEGRFINADKTKKGSDKLIRYLKSSVFSSI